MFYIPSRIIGLKLTSELHSPLLPTMSLLTIERPPQVLTLAAQMAAAVCQDIFSTQGSFAPPCHKNEQSMRSSGAEIMYYKSQPSPTHMEMEQSQGVKTPCWSWYQFWTVRGVNQNGSRTLLLWGDNAKQCFKILVDGCLFLWELFQ